MKKILTVIGTRPEAIKLAPIVLALQNRPETFKSVVCVTAQHRELLDQPLEIFGIRPDHDLNLMQPNQTLEQLTGRVLTHIQPVLAVERPDWVLIQGDTTTVMATALAAYYQNVKVGHVEAGLRTHDKRQPFPEEINRRIAGVIADLHFAPTEWAAGNLLREGVAPASVLVTGNPVIDALHYIQDQVVPSAEVAAANIPQDRHLILVTAHRRENFGDGMGRIFGAIQTLAARFQESVHFAYPVHPNPNVKGMAEEMLGDLPNVTLLPPQDYLSFVYLMKHAHIILTDSGGVQEEAPGLGKPVLVFRNKTERPEGVETGVVELVGTDQALIVRRVSELLTSDEAYRAMSQAHNPYGDGQAAGRIADALAGAETG